MTFGRLLVRNLFYHWRGNLAVLLGVIVGSAVLTGALLVGDSLRGSLRELTLGRLGWVDQALTAGRFFREELAQDLHAEHVSPVLLLQGSVAKTADPTQGTAPRVPKVVLFGVDSRFWPEGQMPVVQASRRPSSAGETPAPRPQGRAFWDPAETPEMKDSGVVLGTALARDLNASVGDKVTFFLQKVSAAPRESVLGRRRAEDVIAPVRLTVAAVLSEDSLGSRFSLHPTPAEPRNAFVPLRVLQGELRAEDRATRALPPNPVNSVLVQGGEPDALEVELRRHLRFDDLGLVLREPKGRTKPVPIPRPDYLSLESRQMFLQPAIRQAVERAGLSAGPTLVYLVNNMAQERRLWQAAAAVLAPPAPGSLLRAGLAYYAPLQVPYCIIAALDPTQPTPLGPFLPPDFRRLADDEILLVDWTGSPLSAARPGTGITLSYYQPEQEGRLEEQTAVFRLLATAPITGARKDPNLTPVFPGVTDKATFADWDPPFPFDRTRVQQADEDYWTEHHTTPKGYITLKAGQKLWGNRFGQYTSIRLVPAAGQGKEEIESRILAHLDPRQFGLVFRDVRGHGLEASAGGGFDFGLLFLGFSCFLIAAALLLVGLLFRLNLDRRAAEIGLLLATGYRRGSVRWLLLLEGGLLAALGGVAGCAAAIGYAWLMLDYLSASWPGGLSRSFLQLHVTPLSFVIGYVASLVVSVLTILWATRVLSGAAPASLLAGATVTTTETAQPARVSWSPWVAGFGALGAIASLVAGGMAKGHEAQAGSFFSSGALLLVALVAVVWTLMRRARYGSAGGRPPSLANLGARNAARHPLRSVLTVGLLASATFVVVAVQAFHREAGEDFLNKDGGSGGFPLLAESELPFYQDLNSPSAQENLEFSDHTQEAMQQAVVYSFRVSAGDDASCLNLYKPLQPRLMGVPNALVARGGFQFGATEAQTTSEIHNPWLLLDRVEPDGAIPVLGENNTVEWMLHKGLGQELEVNDGEGRPVRLRIVGLLQDSVFQSELLMSDANFLQLFPRQEGFPFFLITTPPEEAGRVRSALMSEKQLADHGFYVTPTAERLQSYLAVENTYLATFQALGGLGLLLGALGLAVVLLRSVWERRAELALLRALGFRRSALGWLVLAENSYLLALGLGLGTAAALLAVAPYLAGSAGTVMWWRLVELLGLVLAIGLAAGTAAVLSTLRAPLLPALRRE